VPHRRKAQHKLFLARPSGLTGRLAGIFLLGLALFNPPLLSVFNAPVFVMGVPLLYLYLFAAWAGLILILALAVERRGGASARKDPP
jgi:hypothetical protein